jgi:hypothetical protein
MDFLYFLASKTRVSPTDIVSSLSPPRCRLSSGRCHHVATSCHASFSLSQDELAAFVLSSNNASSHRLPSRAETKALNLYHCCQPPFPNHPTSTLHCYKKSHLNLNHSPHHSTVSLFCLLPSHSTTPSELHPPPSFLFTAVPHSSSLRTRTPMVMN